MAATTYSNSHSIALRLEGAGISAMWELIAIDQIDERHRLPAQRVDDVMVVDHMAMLAAPLRRPTGLREGLTGPE